MRGEFVGVKREIVGEIFEPVFGGLSGEDSADEEFWGDLFREAIPQPIAPKEPNYLSYNDDGELYLDGDLTLYREYRGALESHKVRIERYNDAASNSSLVWQYVVVFFLDQATTEREIVKSLEDAFGAIEDAGGDHLANAYYQNVEAFLEKYSLRYDLRRPAYGNSMTLHPTLSGMFTRLIRDLKIVTSQDAALSDLMHDFEEAVRDLKTEKTSRKIKQCLAAQFNLLEALLSQSPAVLAFNEGVVEHNERTGSRRHTANTFGAMCDQAGAWPHEEVLKSVKSIYGFGSDYPGIRHGGTPANAKRDIDMRDMVSMSIILAGFTPYFSDELEAERIYSD